MKQQQTHKYIISKCRLKSEIHVYEKNRLVFLIFFLVSASRTYYINVCILLSFEKKASSRPTLVHIYMNIHFCTVICLKKFVPRCTLNGRWPPPSPPHRYLVIFYSISLCRIDERFFFLFARLCFALYPIVLKFYE